MKRRSISLKNPFHSIKEIRKVLIMYFFNTNKKNYFETLLGLLEIKLFQLPYFLPEEILPEL